MPMTQNYEAAFGTAFEEYADALFRHAFFRLSSCERATDLTQETFIKAWDYLREGGEIRQWRSFLYRILNNLIIDEYRKKKTQSLDALFETDPARAMVYTTGETGRAHEERLDEELLLEKIRTLIPRLPETQRTVVLLRYIDGLSPKEIASSLGISENVVSVRIHRGVEHLRRWCEPFIQP